MGKELTKEAAAKRLKMSIRSLQRAVEKRKLTPVQHRGKSGKMETFFDSDDIDRYKEELSQVVILKKEDPPVTTDASQALTRVDAPRGSAFADTLSELLERLVSAQERAMLPPAEPPVTKDDASRQSRVDVALADKPLLKIAEASQLTGLSYQILRGAIEDKRLKASLIGRAWRIRRTHLDSFIKRL